ncbi:MAG: hypothetical protein HKM07_02215 [Chlamydiae bacterium]|nr:hypothetical protein [Chlamydiota bacterium]
MLPKSWEPVEDKYDLRNSLDVFPISERLMAGSYQRLEDVNFGFYLTYEILLNELSYNSNLDLQDAIPILLGQQCYLWGEQFPDYYYCVDYRGWECIAKSAF